MFVGLGDCFRLVFAMLVVILHSWLGWVASVVIGFSFGLVILVGLGWLDCRFGFGFVARCLV